MHSDIKKRRSFLAPLFAAGDAQRWATKTKGGKNNGKCYRPANRSSDWRSHSCTNYCSNNTEWATKKVAKFKPPYGMAYKSAFLGTVAGLILGFMIGVAFGQTEQGKLYLLSMVAGFLLQGAIYGQLIKDGSSTSIGLGKGFAIAGIQFAIGIGILVLITGAVLVIAS